MEISQATIDIMKNFTTINNSIWLNEPQCMKTISIAENIIGIYDTEETFPEWQLYNSVPFMSLVSLFGLSKIDFDFGERAVVLKSPGTRATVVYDDIDIIPKLGDLKASSSYKKYDDFSATFDLTTDKIGQIQKAANILGLPDMKVVMRDGKGLITINDDENPDSNLLKMAIVGEGDCEITMMVKNLQLHTGDYSISVSSGVMSKFQHSKMASLFYVVAAKKS
jgi:hypothetical protein